MPPSKIFEKGCRDTTTAGSRALATKTRILRTKARNPTWVPRDTKGNKVNIPQMSAAVSSATGGGGGVSTTSVQERYRTQKVPPMVSRYRDLVARGVTVDGFCRHDPQRALDAQDTIYGRRRDAAREEEEGGVSVSVDLEFDPNVHLASRCGYYMVDGGLVYMHTDGSLCRVTTVPSGTPCSCGGEHVG